MKKKKIMAFYELKALEWAGSPYFYGKDPFSSLYNAREMSFVRSSVQIFQNDLVLDIGCGPGRWIVEFTSKGAVVVALDISRNTIKFARQKIRKLFPRSEESLNFILGDAEHLPFKTGSFNVVNCFDAFPHFPHPVKSLGEMRRVLKPNGLIIFEPSNIFSPIGMGLHFVRLLYKKLGIKGGSLIWTQWNRYDNIWRVKRWIKLHGLELEQVISVGYFIPLSRNFVKLFQRLETCLENTVVASLLGSRIIFKCRLVSRGELNRLSPPSKGSVLTLNDRL